MQIRAWQFAAILFTALMLAPGAAHLFALPNKIGLARDDYFITQQVYRGWAILGLLIFAALLSNAVLAYLVRDQDRPFLFALLSALAIFATLVIFFVWVFPGNQATDNWTSIPANWEALRSRWEYGHAASAIVSILALCSTTLSVVTRR
jgi:hypothetical protein